MTPALLLLAALAAPSPAATYDCSRAADQERFRQAFAALRRDSRETHAQLERRRLGVGGDPRSCTLSQWCLAQGASIRFVADSNPPVVVIQSVPPSDCEEPWVPLCEAPACRYATPDLGGDGAAVLVRSREGEVRSTDPGEGEGGRSLPPRPWHIPVNPFVSELASELGGISFAWRGKAYTAQFLTRFIFRHRVEGGSVRFEDTGATLHHSAFEALCASGPYPCSAEEGKSCSEQAGLARRGRTFRDARRGRWRDDSSGACRPSGR